MRSQAMIGNWRVGAARRAAAAEARFPELESLRGSELVSAIPAMRRLKRRYRDAGRWSDAVDLQLRFLRRLVAECGDNHEQVPVLEEELADNYMEEGETGQAIPLLKRVAAHRLAAEGLTDPADVDVLGEAFRIRWELAFAYLCEHEPRKARAILAPAADRLRAFEVPARATLVPAVEYRSVVVEDLLARAVWQQGQYPQARLHFQHVYELRLATRAKFETPKETHFNKWIYSLDCHNQ